MTFGNSKSGKFFVTIALIGAVSVASGLIVPSAVHADSYGDGWGDTTWGDSGWGDTTYGSGWGDTSYGSGWGDTTYGSGWGDTTYGSGWGDTTSGSGYWGDTSYGNGWGDTTTGGNYWGDTTTGSGYWGDTTTGGNYWGDTTTGNGYWGDTTLGTDYTYTPYSYTDYGGYTDYYGYTDYSGYTSGGTSGGYSYSTPSYSYSTPSYSFSAPSYYYSTPTYNYSTPRYTYTQPVVRQQQQQQQQQTSQPINIVNNNINTNTNTNTNTPAVTTITPISAGVTQYPVVYQPTYTYPTYYNYTTPTYTYPTYQRPYCTISISNYGGSGYGAYGTQLATLTWSSSYGTSAYISPNVGTAALSGSMTVYPTSGTVYTMTVTGLGGSATCQSAPYYVAQPIVYQNPTPSVSLTQIPYTGFDFGPIGDSLYWLALLAFAAAGAYLMVYYRGGAMTLATAYAARNAAMKPVKVVEQVVEATAQKIENTFIQPVLSNLPVREAFGTTDTMNIVTSKKESDMPRIVITRE